LERQYAATAEPEGPTHRLAIEVFVTPANRQLEALFSLCESSDFTHRADVLALLSDAEVASHVGARVEVHEVAVGHDLASIYRVRAEHLTRLEQNGTLTDPSPSGRRLPATLAADVRCLSAVLTAASDQPIQIWTIDLADRTTYILFVLVRDHLLAGAVKSVSEAPWLER
jgi:hypothetical protein